MLDAMTPRRLTLDGRIVTDTEVMSLALGTLSSMPAHMAGLFAFLHQWFDDAPTIAVTTSGSTGSPKVMQADKRRMAASAVRTCDFLGLTEGQTALLAMDLRYIGAKMMVVRAIVRGLDLTVVPATGNPMKEVGRHIDFASFVPMQLYNMLRDDGQRAKLADTGNIIVGGGAVSTELESLAAALPGRVYSTYGMTETLSHIAMRRLGPAGDGRYHPLDGVSLSLSPDHTLVIDAPDICATRLVTNDIAEMSADGSFVIAGRLDNMIVTGGIKVIPEQVEAALAQHLHCPLAVTSVPDGKFGEAVTLLVGTPHPAGDELRQAIAALPPYHRPKHVFMIADLPHTPNGKIDRAGCRRSARDHAGSTPGNCK